MLDTKDWLAIVGLTVGLLQYRKTSRGEFLKPIREAQLDLYQQASSAAAKLATIPRSDPEWNKARSDFLTLYYGPLAIVENYNHRPSSNDTDPTVEEAMMAFKVCLDLPSCEGSNDMKNLSLGLAHTCRVSIGATWGFTADPLDGDYQNLIVGYREKRRQSVSDSNR
jgi:hypothetical protein